MLELVRREGHALLLDDAVADREMHKARSVVRHGLRSVMVGIKTCQYRSMGRQSPGGSGNCILEQQAITRKSLEVGTGGPCISVDRKMIGSQGIDHNQ